MPAASDGHHEHPWRGGVDLREEVLTYQSDLLHPCMVTFSDLTFPIASASAAERLCLACDLTAIELNNPSERLGRPIECNCDGPGRWEGPRPPFAGFGTPGRGSAIVAVVHD